MTYHNKDTKQCKSLFDKRLTKIRENEGVMDKDGNPEQPCGIALHVVNAPKKGLILHVTRYFDEGGVTYQAYRTPITKSGKRYAIHDDVYIPMAVVPRVAQELLKLAGIAEVAGPPPEVPDAEARRRARQLAVVGAR